MKNIYVKMLKKLGCLVMVVILLAMPVSGCAKEEEKEKSLTVYYVKDTSYYEDVLKFFSQLNMKLHLNIVTFETEDEMANKLANEMASSGGPDVVLLSNNSKFDVYKTMKGENFADLSPYFKKDSTYTADAYYQNIIDLTKVNGKQYIVPFSFDINGFYMRKSVMDKLQISKIDNNVNFETYMSTLLTYQKQLVEQDSSTIGIGLMGSKSADDYSNFTRICGLRVLDQNGKVNISKDAFKSSFVLLKSILEDQKKNANVVNASVSASEYFGHFNSFFANPIIMPLFFTELNAAYHTKYNDTIVYNPIPSTNNDGSFNASIKNYGVVSGKCKNVEEAYKLLKFILDYNPNNILDEECPLPLKKKTNSALVDAVRRGYFSLAVSSTESFLTQPWSNETLDSYNYVLEHISSATISNVKIEEMVKNTMQGYINGSEDFDTSYNKLLSQLKLYAQE